MKCPPVLAAVFVLAACGSDAPASKTDKWCDKLMHADVDMTGLRQIYTDAINDGAVVSDLREECGGLVQLVLDNGGTTD